MEEKCAGGILSARRDLLRHLLPRLHLLLLLLDVRLVPMEPTVYVVALVLTVESLADEAVSSKGNAEF